jgi:hypothetical protein
LLLSPFVFAVGKLFLAIYSPPLVLRFGLLYEVEDVLILVLSPRDHLDANYIIRVYGYAKDTAVVLLPRERKRCSALPPHRHMLRVILDLLAGR